MIQETVCGHGTVTRREPEASLVVITHGSHERRTSWEWRTPADRKWSGRASESRGPRLVTNKDKTEEALTEWSAGIATLETEGFGVETGRHIAFPHLRTTTERNGHGRGRT